MMKVKVLLLAALVGYISGAVIKPEQGVDTVQVFDSSGEVAPTSIQSRNVISGIIGAGDRLLHRGYYSKAGVANEVQTQDIRFVGATNAIRITYISALTVFGATQSALAEVTAGGVNTNNVTLRLTSLRGAGFDFWVEIWGR